MARVRRWLLVGASLLAACQAGAPTTRKAPAPHAAASATIAGSSHIPTVAPVASAGAIASAAPVSASVPPATAAAQKLLKPATGTITLAGTINLDASYIVASGGGNIVAQGGGNIVAQGGGNIVAAGGGNIVAQGGGNLTVGGQIVAQGGGNIVAQGGGNFISHNGSAIVAAGGGNIVAQGGGNIVAQGGGNIVAQGGGNIVAQGGGNALAKGGAGYALLADATPATTAQAEGGAAPVPAGTILPAAGMRIQVFSLDKRQLLPLGVDGHGQPVYSIYSNAQGAYEIYIDKSLQGNVLVEATDPAKDDARTTYDVATPADASKPAVVDEDTALVTRYIIESFAARFEQIVEQPPDVTSNLILKGWVMADDSVKLFVNSVVGDLYKIAIDAGVDKASPAVRHAAVHRAALAVLGMMQLDASPAAPPGDSGLFPIKPEDTALAVIKDEFTYFRDQTAKRMQATPPLDPNTLPFVEQANCTSPYRIEKPSDIIVDWVTNYFGVVSVTAFDGLTASMTQIDPDTLAHYDAPAGFPVDKLGPIPELRPPVFPNIAMAHAYAMQEATTSVMIGLLTNLKDPVWQQRVADAFKNLPDEKDVPPYTPPSADPACIAKIAVPGGAGASMAASPDASSTPAASGSASTAASPASAAAP